MKQFLREMWGFVLFAACMIGAIVFSVVSMRRGYVKSQIEKNYCGKIIATGYDAPSSGHKSHTDATYWMVILDEDIHSGIRVHVTPGCYYARKVGDRTCFSLTGAEMTYYGNTNDNNHLK